MSIIRCDKHDITWDSDTWDNCPVFAPPSKSVWALVDKWREKSGEERLHPIFKNCLLNHSIELDEALASPVPASGWVKCSERMPERGETVLVLCKGQWCGPIAIARLWAFGQWGLAANGEGDSLNPEDVTDWMPLPAAPVAPKGETE